MVRTLSTMVPLGTEAPDFSLPSFDGAVVTRGSFAGKPLLVMFICNHCPYVKHLRDHIAATCRSYSAKGLAIVGISSNDVENYPDDSPEKMAEEAEAAGYDFPYLYDETQEVAKAYRAACTPDFFLYDENHRLVYRGQYDDSRPKTDTPVTGRDLIAAMDAVLAGEAPSTEQRNSVGCNIKWKDGSAPEYFVG